MNHPTLARRAARPGLFSLTLLALAASATAQTHAQANVQTDTQPNTQTSAPASEKAAAPAGGTLPAVTVKAAPDAPATVGLGHGRRAQASSRLGLSVRETPASVSVITQEQIRARHITRAQDAVVSLPGMAQAPAPGNGFSSLSARGFVGHSSVAQLIDGTRAVVGFGTVTYPFSTWPIEAVEVLSGPASVLHGDGAIGAAVNYVTKKPLFERSEREAFVSAGSWKTVSAGVGLRGPISDTLAYSAYFDAGRSSGVRTDSAYSRQNTSLALALRPSGRFQATLMYDGGHNKDATYFGTPTREGRVPGEWSRASFNVADARVRYIDQALRLRLRHDLNAHMQLRNETYLVRTNRLWHNAESYRYNSRTGLIDREYFIDIGHRLQQTGHRLEWQAEGLGHPAHKLLAGFDISRTRFHHYNNAPYGGSDSIDPARGINRPGLFASPDPFGLGRQMTLTTAAAFAESHWSLSPQWSLLGGLRADRIRLDVLNLRARAQTPDRVNYHPVTGRLGLVWKASDTLTLYGQVATATDPVSGALSLPGGSTRYDLTRGRQWEAGLKGDLPALQGQWSIALYRIEKRNLLTPNPERPTETLQVGRQNSSGIELSFSARPLPALTLDANLALVRARYGQFAAASGGRLIDYSGRIPSGAPQRLLNLWAAWQINEQWQISAGLRHQGRHPINPANTAWLPAHTSAQAALTWQIAPGRSLSLAVHNLTNRRYPLSGNSAKWLLAAPRHITLTGRFSF
ncbi:MAG: TonB-dependent receptor [Ottowia sp.]